MSIAYKRLTENELDIFIEMRINQLREEGAKEDIDLKPALKDYYKRHMTDGTFVSWIAVDGSKIIGTSGMSFVEKPPYFGCPSGKMGLLSSMFTNPAMLANNHILPFLMFSEVLKIMIGCDNTDIFCNIGSLTKHDFCVICLKVISKINKVW